MNNKVYIIRALTNLHVGSGDMNFNIVDNEVQRDVISKFPIIHSSSLKGALREYFEHKEKKDEDFINSIFGGSSISGSYKFFDGNILSIPVRSNKRQFFMATCPKIIKKLVENLKLFGIESKLDRVLENLFSINIDKKKAYIFSNEKGVKIEDYIADNLAFEGIDQLERIFGSNIAYLGDKAFEAVCEELPVIARNKLENGISRSLWYEEIVPRESSFYFVVIKGENYQEEFDSIMQSDIVQIGAGASIGYGYTKITDISVMAGEINE